MKLSEAIKFGSTLRPESHQERFCNVENRGLCSDAWGAACEAVQPAVASFNWNLRDKGKLQKSLDALNAIQHHYFDEYWHMPARCPFAYRELVERNERIINTTGLTQAERETQRRLSGVTSECPLVSTVAGLVDHAFYVHGNSREQIAEFVEIYENMRSASIFLSMEHYQNESLRQAIQHRLSQAQFARLMQKRRRIYPVH